LIDGILLLPMHPAGDGDQYESEWAQDAKTLLVSVGKAHSMRLRSAGQSPFVSARSSFGHYAIFTVTGRYAEPPTGIWLQTGAQKALEQGAI